MNYRHSSLRGLLSILIAAIALAACDDPASSRGERPAGAPSGAVATGGGPAVQVTAKEFSLMLDPAQAKAGPITFVVKNDGHAPHNFRIRGNGVEQQTQMIESGETGQLTVELTPGTYEYQCTVGGHEQLGMKGTLTVAP
jgi:uncharacterized cupredoxin-like copper-binding protein